MIFNHIEYYTLWLLFQSWHRKKTAGAASHRQREWVDPSAFVQLQAAVQRSRVARAVAQKPGAHGEYREISASVHSTGEQIISKMYSRTNISHFVFM